MKMNSNGTYGGLHSIDNSVPSDTWTHVAFVWNSTYHRIYINGVLNAVEEVPNVTIADDLTHNLYIGAYEQGLGYNFRGYIDELRISNIERTSFDANRPPVLTSNISDQTFDEDTNITISLSNYFSDPDGTSLAYSASGNTTIDLQISGDIATLIPTTNWNGQETITFSATDPNGNFVDSNPIIVTVNPVNDAPILNSIANQTINENDLFDASLLVIASDPDGDTLTISYPLPINSTGQWQTDYNSAGNYSVNVSVSDGELMDSKIFNLEVLNVNRAPIINTFSPTSIISVDEGSSLALTIDASDPDGDSLSYKWYLDNAEVSTNQNYTYSPDYNSQGNHNITIIISDSLLEALQYWNITVNDITQTSGGGGGGGGGGSSCTPSWKYENWGQCKDGKKYRKAIDENQCEDSYEEWLECTNETKEEIKEERKEEIGEGKGESGSSVTGAAVTDLDKGHKGIGQYVKSFAQSVKETFVNIGQAVKNFVVKIKEVLWGK